MESVHEDPLIERLILVFGDQTGVSPLSGGRVLGLGGNRFIFIKSSLAHQFVRNQECGHISLQLLILSGEWLDTQSLTHNPP